MADPKNKPVTEIRLGLLKAVVWANETERGTRHNVTLARLYRKDDRWHETTSFGTGDLLLLAKLLDRVHDALLDPPTGETGGDE